MQSRSTHRGAESRRPGGACRDTDGSAHQNTYNTHIRQTDITGSHTDQRTGSKAGATDHYENVLSYRLCTAFDRSLTESKHQKWNDHMRSADRLDSHGSAARELSSSFQADKSRSDVCDAFHLSFGVIAVIDGADHSNPNLIFHPRLCSTLQINMCFAFLSYIGH